MAAICFSALFVLIIAAACPALGMEPRFYDKACPNAEPTIFSFVQQRYNVDKSIAPRLIRLLLHDCFVRGCDASILLKSTPQNKAERDALPNMSLGNVFDFIDQVKERLEQQCPETVSCADVIAIAARDAVRLTGGQNFELLLGRHDGMVSLASEALSMLPDISDSLPQALAAFNAKGFTAQEFVALLGAHSIGTAQCNFVDNRLFNFEGTGKADPSLSPSFFQSLKEQCASSESRIFIDQSTPFSLDNSYFKEISEGRAVLAVDEQLVQQESTKFAAARFAHNDLYFQTFFQHSIKKLSLLDVLTHGGETRRRKCYEVNS